jgi:hypothetical protein
MAKKLKAIPKDYEKIIHDLEDELVRKQEIIDNLKKENLVLLKTALKNAVDKLE